MTAGRPPAPDSAPAQSGAHGKYDQPNPTPDIAANAQRVIEAVASAADRANRPRGSITVLAVSKTQPAAAVRAAFAAGLTHFGENYLQDALPKIAELADLPLTWHFIGALQSNKTRAVAEHFDWLHTVDRLKIAQRVSAQRPAGSAPLNVCIQVNVDDDPNKAGVAPSEVAALAAEVAQLPNIALRGLMTILNPDTDPAVGYRHLATLNAEIGGLPVLSMGMSADFEAAITAGAHFVRVGTAIFGPRRTVTNR